MGRGEKEEEEEGRKEEEAWEARGGGHPWLVKESSGG
jgi:hypothetical protein